MKKIIKNLGSNYDCKAFAIIQKNQEWSLKELEENSIQYVFDGTIPLVNSDYVINNYWCEKHKLKSEDIIKIITSINNLLHFLAYYFLNENNIDILGTMIDIKTNKLIFTYISNYNSDFSFDFSKFLLKLLRFTDINDKKALTLAYDLFLKSSKENYTIDEIMEVINNAN